MMSDCRQYEDFKVGVQCLILPWADAESEYIGTICTIVRAPYEAMLAGRSHRYRLTLAVPVRLHDGVEIAWNGNGIAFEPHELLPLKGDPDEFSRDTDNPIDIEFVRGGKVVTNDEFFA